MCWTYLAIFTMKHSGVGLAAVITGQQVGVDAGRLSRQVVQHQEFVQHSSTRGAPLKSNLRKGPVHSVFAAMGHPKTVQHLTPALDTQVAAAHLLFVRFFQIIKALSRVTINSGGARRRTTGRGYLSR